jgi:hypothetical protein
MSEATTPIVLPPAVLARWNFEMGRAALAMDLRPRLKRFSVHDGSRRMLGEKTPRPALDLRLIRRNDREC